MMTGIILFLAIVFLAVSSFLSVVDPSTGATLLSFFSTVIVSWLISNFANEKAAKKKLEDLAKVSHRHLGDVEQSALSIEQSIKDLTYDFTYKSEPPSDEAVILFLKLLDSRIGDLKARITSTNRDWYDLLSDEAKKEVKDKDTKNPEAEIIEGNTTTPDLSPVTKYRGSVRVTEVAKAIGAAEIAKAVEEAEAVAEAAAEKVIEVADAAGMNDLKEDAGV